MVVQLERRRTKRKHRNLHHRATNGATEIETTVIAVAAVKIPTENEDAARRKRRESTENEVDETSIPRTRMAIANDASDHDHRIANPERKSRLERSARRSLLVVEKTSCIHTANVNNVDQ